MGEAKRISDPLRSGFPTSGTVMQRYSHFTSQFVFSLSQNYFVGIFCLSTSICLLNKFVSYFRAIFELLVFWIIQSLFSHIRIMVLWKDIIGSTVWATVIKLLFTKSMNVILSSVVQNRIPSRCSLQVLFLFGWVLESIHWSTHLFLLVQFERF